MERFVDLLLVIPGSLIWLFLIFLAILWFVLPFAIFGTKRRIDAGNVLLTRIDIRLEEQTKILQRIEGLAKADERGPVTLVEEAPPE